MIRGRYLSADDGELKFEKRCRDDPDTWIGLTAMDLQAVSSFLFPVRAFVNRGLEGSCRGLILGFGSLARRWWSDSRHVAAMFFVTAIMFRG